MLQQFISFRVSGVFFDTVQQAKIYITPSINSTMHIQLMHVYNLFVLPTTKRKKLVIIFYFSLFLHVFSIILFCLLSCLFSYFFLIKTCFGFCVLLLLWLYHTTRVSEQEREREKSARQKVNDIFAFLQSTSTTWIRVQPSVRMMTTMMAMAEGRQQKNHLQDEQQDKDWKNIYIQQKNE